MDNFLVSRPAKQRDLIYRPHGWTGERNFSNVARRSGRNPALNVMPQLARLKHGLQLLLGQGPALHLETFPAVEGILTDPCLIASEAVAPEFNPRYRDRVSHMVEARTETRREDAKCGTIWLLPKKAGHPMHVFLASWTFALPVDNPYVTAMSKNGAVGKMKLCVRPRRHASVRPRHPGMRVMIRIEEYGPLSQKFIACAKRVLDRPIHSKPQFSFPTGDIDPFRTPRYFVKYRNDLNRAVRDRKA